VSRWRPRGVLLFSCNGRGRGFFGEPDHDAARVAAATDAAPMAGFFAQGELGPIGGRNFLHTFTASMAVFCEPRDPVPALDRAAEADPADEPPAPTEPSLGEVEAAVPPPDPFQPPQAPETPEPV
jgi:FIST C domain